MMQPKGIGRRDFMRAGAGIVSAGLAVAQASVRAKRRARRRTIQGPWYPFTEHPDSDTCWFAIGGTGRPDLRRGLRRGRAWRRGEAGALQRTEGMGWTIFSTSPRWSTILATPATPRSAKIHYSFAPSMHDHVMYMATHLSGPPIDLPVYNPWYSWHDKKRLFRGAALLAFDTQHDRVLWWDTMIPKEGCRCLLHDEERGLL